MALTTRPILASIILLAAAAAGAEMVRRRRHERITIYKGGADVQDGDEPSFVIVDEIDELAGGGSAE